MRQGHRKAHGCAAARTAAPLLELPCPTGRRPPARRAGPALPESSQPPAPLYPAHSTGGTARSGPSRTAPRATGASAQEPQGHGRAGRPPRQGRASVHRPPAQPGPLRRGAAPGQSEAAESGMCEAEAWDAIEPGRRSMQTRRLIFHTYRKQGTDLNLKPTLNCLKLLSTKKIPTALGTPFIPPRGQAASPARPPPARARPH